MRNKKKYWEYKRNVCRSYECKLLKNKKNIIILHWINYYIIIKLVYICHTCFFISLNDFVVILSGDIIRQLVIESRVSGTEDDPSMTSPKNRSQRTLIRIDPNGDDFRHCLLTSSKPFWQKPSKPSHPRTYPEQALRSIRAPWTGLFLESLFNNPISTGSIHGEFNIIGILNSL